MPDTVQEHNTFSLNGMLYMQF